MSTLIKEVTKGPRGHVRITLEEEGNSWLVFNDTNLVVNGGREILSKRAGGVTVGAISQIKVGTLGHTGDILTPATPLVTQTTLVDTNPFIKTQEAGSPVFVTANPEYSARFIFVMEKVEGNGGGTKTYTEAGMFTSDGIMFSVENFPGLIKNNKRRYIFEWVIYF